MVAMWRRRRAAKPKTVIPDVADHPVMSAGVSMAKDDLDAKFEDALATVLAVGDRYRTCSACKSSATDIEAVDYVQHGRRGVVVRVEERCLNCNRTVTWRAAAATWAAMEAMRAWEGWRTARAIMLSEKASGAYLDEIED